MKKIDIFGVVFWAVIFILLGLVLIGMTLFFVGEVIKEEVGTKEAPCYDKYGSEIKELTCEEQVYDYKWLSWYMEW